MTQRSKKQLNCKYCTKKFYPIRSRDKIQKFCSRSCGSKNQRGKDKQYRDKDLLSKLYLQDKLSVKSVANKLNCSPSNIAYYMRKYKIKLRSSNCARQLNVLQKRERNPNWKGGRFMSKNGYIYILNTNSSTRIYKKYYIAEQNAIMEKKIGRPVKQEERVHHLNGNKQDNRIENLMLFSSQSEHMIFEQKIASFAKQLIWGNIKPELKEELQKLLFLKK